MHDGVPRQNDHAIFELVGSGADTAMPWEAPHAFYPRCAAAPSIAILFWTRTSARAVRTTAAEKTRSIVRAVIVTFDLHGGGIWAMSSTADTRLILDPTQALPVAVDVVNLGALDAWFQEGAIPALPPILEHRA